MALGAVLGTLSGRVLFPRAESKPPIRSEVAAPSAESPAHPGKSLYGRVPRLKSVDIEAGMRLLEQRKRSGNPLRVQSTINRLLLQLAGDPSKVPELVALINSDKDFRRMIEPIFTRWAESDPVGAMQAVEALDNYHLKWQAIRGVMKSWAESDPDAALAYLENSMRTDSARRE